jgi:hypothetical protein
MMPNAIGKKYTKKRCQICDKMISSNYEKRHMIEHGLDTTRMDMSNPLILDEFWRKHYEKRDSLIRKMAEFNNHSLDFLL